ncbi:MAG: glycosyltransferase [Parcubacteria group bacterium]|jgi:glycosyltransferase involved in cell wall biosynthesis
MKILTIAATPFFSNRGGHMRIYNEAKYLKKLGADVRLSTYHIGEDVPGFEVVRIRGPKKYKKNSPGFSWGKIWLDWKLLFLVRREIRKFRPDAIHAHLYEGLAVGYLAKRLSFSKVPIVFDLQGNIDEEFRSYSRKNSFARKIFVWLSKIVIKWADKIVISSENVICRRPTSTIIIKDGIDLDLFENLQDLSEEERDKIEEIKNWSGDKKILAYIGGLSDNKGVGELLEALPKVEPSERNSWKLLLGGYGSDEVKYKEFIEENNLEERVYFSGPISYFSLPHYLALADAGIDPKKGSAESSGKIANLMAAGLPIICFENEFNRSRIGEKGIYLKDMSELGEKLDNIQDTGKIKYNIDDLSEEKEVRKLLEIFQSLTK